MEAGLPFRSEVEVRSNLWIFIIRATRQCMSVIPALLQKDSTLYGRLAWNSL